MKRFLLIFIIFFIVSLLYFFFTPHKINNKKQFFINNVFSTNYFSKNKSNYNGFYYDFNECGYFDTQNGMLFYMNVEDDYLIEANNYFYLIYQKIGDQIVTYLPDGTKMSKIKTFGYPYLIDNLNFFFVLKSNGMGLSLYSMDGGVIIDSLDFTSMITSLSVDKFNKILVSTMDGNTYLYSNTKELLYSSDSKNSLIKIAKSNTFDIDGNYFAVCTGLYPEYIEIYKCIEINNEKEIQIVSKFKTETNFRYDILMEIFNNKLFYEGDNSVCYYDFIKKKHGKIAVPGILNDIKFSEDGNLLVSSSEKNKNYLICFTKKNNKKFYKEFENKIEDFDFIDTESFYFKINNRIVKIVYGET